MINIKKAENIQEYKQVYKLIDKALAEASNENQNGFLLEKDGFDHFSVHYIATSRNQVVGVIRIIFDIDSPKGLPIERHPGIIENINTAHSAEISQFCVKNNDEYKWLFLLLFRHVYQQCTKRKIEKIYFNLSQDTIYLLEEIGLKVQILGKKDYSSNFLTLPALWNASDIDSNIRLTNNKFYKWINKNTVVAEETFDLRSIFPWMYPYSSKNHHLSIAKG